MNKIKKNHTKKQQLSKEKKISSPPELTHQTHEMGYEFGVALQKER